MSYSRHPRTYVLIAVAAITVFASCSANSDAASAGSSNSPVLLVDELLSGAESENSHIASESSIHSCMIGRGFEYEETPFDHGANDIAERVDSRQFREEYGYGLSIDPGPLERSTLATAGDDYAAYLSTMTAREREQYDLSFEECFLEAQAHIEAARANFVESLPSDARELLDAAASGLDPKFIEIEQVWSRCMAEAGYNYGGSAGTFAFLSDELARVSTSAGLADDEDLQELERSIAVTDFDCAANLTDELDARRAEIDRAIRDAVGDGSIYN